MTSLIRLALLATLAISNAWAEKTGRLFFTPQQRAQLEREHTGESTSHENRPPLLVLNGIVQHGNGSRTIWINGTARYSVGPGKQAPDTQAVNIPGKSRSVEIKVGQRLFMQQSTEQ